MKTGLAFHLFYVYNSYMSNENFSTIPHQQRVEKPWGYEIIYTPAELSRAGKILFVKAGKKLSFQYHDQKEETMCLFSGRALIWLENQKGEIEKIEMETQKGYTVRPPQKHRVEAMEDSFILEVSSPETGTTVRIEDNYKRPDETEEIRKSDNRGWQQK